MSESRMTCVFKEPVAIKDGLIRRRFRRELQKYLSRRDVEYAEASPRKMAVFAHDLIGTEINLDGVFERRELELLFSFLKPVLPQLAAGTCLDVGANIGNHTIYFSSRFANVVAFEPNPEVFQLLTFNVRGLRGVSVECVGLGSSARDAVLNEVKGNLGASSLRGSSEGRGVNVSIRRMDDVSVGKPITFIKIDTEGFEAEVLAGGIRTLMDCQPVVVFEQLKSEFERGVTPAVRLLTERGYKICWIGWPGRSGGNVVSVLFAKFIAAFRGRRYRVYCGDSVPARTHSMLIAVPPRFQEALVLG